MNKKIPKIIQRWADSISQRNPTAMTKFYSKQSVLLATFESLLIGREEIEGYFVEFLDKDNLSCKITENYTKTDYDGDTHVANGIYEFTFTENDKPQKVVARYTYVINRGRIITHHSSVNPK